MLIWADIAAKSPVMKSCRKMMLNLPDKNGDVWDKISAVYDYCILGGRWADKEHPYVDTYKNILNRYPDDDESYSIMVDFRHERISYPKQKGLWNDDDLVYVMDTHR